VLYTHPNGAHKGQVPTKNLGINRARGKYICFLDADDTYFANRFDTCVPLLEQNPHINAVCERFVYTYGKGERAEFIREAVSAAQPVNSRDESTTNASNLFLEVINGRFPLHISTITIRRTVLDETGGFPDIYTSQDSAFLLKILASDRILCGDVDPVSAYRIHEKSHCSRLEGQAEFIFNPIRAMIHTYRWLKNRTDVKPEYIETLRSRIEQKFYAYCSRVPNREHKFARDVIGASAQVVSALPHLLMRVRFWKVLTRLVAVKARWARPWHER
jgi:glycosyltransferase involved in cell wall biosynthesis